ncbi:NifU family protein [Actinoplanes sp. NPDC020271]|uniref:NifU family protein n=1 Tax=Actinoplanes sp. NPDC020271 TaxID=3363896 RepID=UPI0037B08D13
MIPIHPQPYPGRTDRLRWIIPTGILSFTGVPATVPGRLDVLLRDGTLAGVDVEPTAVTTVLGSGRTWSHEGARIRSALHAALDDLAGWRPAGPDTGTDDILRAAAAALLDGAVGAVAQSHGGHIELLEVHDGTVTVRLDGACRGCPAARFTLRQRLENQLRRGFPALRAVIDAGDR